MHEPEVNMDHAVTLLSGMLSDPNILDIDKAARLAVHAARSLQAAAKGEDPPEYIDKHAPVEDNEEACFHLSQQCAELTKRLNEIRAILRNRPSGWFKRVSDLSDIETLCLKEHKS